ncbi:MAG: 30S ribosomal protein S16 [Candidatus Nanopelagicales bacterium]
MAVKIKLKRVGKIHSPQYRVIIADARKRRDGRAIEEIGIYQPMQDPSLIQIDSQRAQHWLSVGAQPTEAVLALLKVTGDWQKFKGLPGAEGTLRVAEPKPSRTIAYELATAEAANEPKVPTPKPVVEKVIEVVEETVEAVVEAVEEVVETVEKVVESAIDSAEEAIDERKAEEAVVAEAEQIVDAAADAQDESKD